MPYIGLRYTYLPKLKDIKNMYEAFTPPIDWYRANFTLPARYSLKDLGRTSTFPPGLIIYGKEDLYLSQEVQEESVKLVNNAQLVYIDKANHFVQQDNPAAVNLEMRTFLNHLKSKQQ